MQAKNGLNAMDMTQARLRMVNGQVRVNDVTDHALVDALADVPRERFAPKGRAAQVYADMHVPISDSRWLLRAREFAKLVQALDVQSDDVVLDVACGRGYSTAVLARLAGMVIGLENDHGLVERASQLLGEMDADNTIVTFGELVAGAAAHGPYDVIIVNGAVEDVPDAWFSQLAEDGRLGVFMRDGDKGVARIFKRSGDAIGDRVVFDCSAPLLPGFAKPDAFVFG